MSVELPNGWAVKTIGELVTTTMGQSPPSAAVNEAGEGLPFIQGNAEFGDRFPEPRLFASNCPKIVEAGDILLSVRAPVGEVNVAPQRLCIGRGLAGLRPKNGDNDYLFFALGGLASEFARLSQGSTFDAINGKDLRSICLPLPPLAEQRRIAEVLRSVDGSIAANEAVSTQARTAFQAALRDLLGRQANSWKTTCLGDLAAFVNGRGFKPHEWSSEGLPIIRIQNLNGGKEFNYYSGEFNPKILVMPGDLLFAWSGSRGTSFGPHIWQGPKGVLNYHTWKVVPKEPKDRDFLYFALQHLTKKIENEAHGASALVHMQKAYVVNYEVDLPPPGEREAIANTLNDLLKAATFADRALSDLKEMKRHLLLELLSGRVDAHGQSHCL
ncbi:restriction endonuclease subunit S [Qipengyuania sp. XHP0207]|uniref:restriction endonuclease subunit S n=1 Tax=Qipengyuania sp. XHP0207 TaxID=3038078 RepID=UPI00241C145C|nr:restriction endonuclease subunit S [Qipengyuania sp. XHP0207]MDG5748709.1 restriction endonuclease subunit S [Qipengyuania sp. XHP0207]